MTGNHVLTYNVDIVFCIDATMSMDKLLDKIKVQAVNFCTDVRNAMNARAKHVDTLRARVIAFRDYAYDRDKAMMLTDFFDLPAQNAEFASCIESISAEGGGDDPENALEALAYAIRSDWAPVTPNIKQRHIIVMWTDAPPHPLGHSKSSPGYPGDMPADMQELSAWWGDRANPGYMDNNAKRLLLFAPDDPGWNAITACWNNIIHFPSKAGEGLDEFDYQQIIGMIPAAL